MNAPATKLNVFQQLILQWEQLHPYNAAQAMRLAFDVSRNDLNRAWRESLVSLGLGRVTHDGDAVLHAFAPSDISISSVTTIDGEDSLDAFISGQLNRQFDADELPYRPFMCHSAGGPILGVVYHHWVCDSFCIRKLMQQWLNRLVHVGERNITPLMPARRGYWHHFGPGASSWPVITTFLQQLAQSSRLRRCRRLHVGKSASTQVEFARLSSDSGLVAAIRHTSRQRCVKVNDLFLAALARTAVSIAQLEGAARRSDVALGTIVDLRPLAGRSPGDAFGLFLGFTNTVLRSACLGDNDRLLEAVAAQSKLARDNQVAQSSQLRMAMAVLIGSILDEPALREFYRKRLPLVGGISNVALYNSWVADAHPKHVMEYMRVSPTGPFLPLVITPTTLGDRMQIGVTVRSPSAQFSAPAVGRRFLDELQRLL